MLQLGEMNDKLSTSERLMRQISRTLIQNKIVMAIIAMAIIAVIGIIVYLKWFW